MVRLSLAARFGVPALVLLLASPALATTYTWNDDGGGAWSDAARWTPVGVPGSGDSAVLPTLASAYTVTLDQSPAADAVTLSGGAALELGTYDLANVGDVSNAGTIRGFRGGLDGTRVHNQAGGTIEAASGQTLVLVDSFTNDGTITVGPDEGSVLWLAKSVTVGGTGSIRLSGAAKVDCALARPQHDIWLTIDEGQTVGGAGNVWVPVKVKGRLLQDAVGGPELVLHTYLYNYGTIRVQDGGWINVDCPQVKQYGGTISGNNGTFSVKVGSSGNMGTVDNLNGGVMLADGGNLHFTAGEMVDGNYRCNGDTAAVVCDEYAWVQNPHVEEGAVLRIDGLLDASVDGSVIDNSGTIRLRGRMNFGGPSTNHLSFTGTGQLLLEGGTLDSPVGCLVTNSAGHTITGCGTVSANLDNQGTIAVDCGGGNMVLKTQPIDNRGTLVVRSGGISIRNVFRNRGAIDGSGGTLKVEYGGSVDNRQGTMVAGKGNLFLGWKTPAASIVGGTLVARGGGTVQNVGLATLTDVRLGHGTTLRTIAGATTTVNGANFVNDGVNEVAQGGTFQVAQGTVYDQSLGTTALSGGSLKAPGGLALEGLTRGFGTIAGDVVNAGVIAPDAAGLSIAGAYRQMPVGSLSVPAGSGATLRVSGPATLDGSVVLRVEGGLAPDADATYPVMTYASHSGAFSHVESGSSLAMSPVYESGSFALTGAAVVGVPDAPALPARLALVASSNGLRLELPGTADVDVRAYDVTGREVARLATGSLAAGVHPLAFAAPARGVYFARATVRGSSGVEVRTARIVALR